MEINLANELFALGRLIPLEKIERRNQLKELIDSEELQEKVRKICVNLFVPIEYDKIYEIIAKVKPHIKDIPSMLSAIGKASLNPDEEVMVPMQTRNLSLHKIPLGDGVTDHKINESLFTRTDVLKIQTFLVVFSHFYYRVAARDGDNF